MLCYAMLCYAITCIVLTDHTRYSFWYKILPLVMIGYADEVDELRVDAMARFNKVCMEYCTILIHILIFTHRLASCT